MAPLVYLDTKLPDAIHLATALGLECPYFLTADTGLEDEYRLTHTRYGVTRGPLTTRVVRPELDELSALIAEIESQ